MNLMLSEEWSTSPSRAVGRSKFYNLRRPLTLAARAQRGRGTQATFRALCIRDRNNQNS
jgi:hypothetical protein